MSISIAFTAFYQGIRILLMRISMILGPLWASSTLDNLSILFGMNLFAALVLLVSSKVFCMLIVLFFNFLQYLLVV